jgi:hypothetical protein
MALYQGERPEHLAETIVLEPTTHGKRRRDWHKRDVKIHKSQEGRYWITPHVHHSIKFDAWATKQGVKQALYAAPVKGMKKIKPQPRPDNPTPYFTERPKFVMYSREQFEEDIRAIEYIRSLLRTRFVDGQPKFKGQYGPFVDGLAFKYHDDACLAAIKECEGRLGATQGIIQKAKEAAKAHYPTPEQAASKHWNNIGKTPAVAKAFEHMGYKTRKIEAGHGNNHYYQVLARTRRPNAR